jgi:hypothetical protein
MVNGEYESSNVRNQTSSNQTSDISKYYIKYFASTITFLVSLVANA